MNQNLKIKLYAFTIDCKDPSKLASFYAKLLGWNIIPDDEFITVAPPGIDKGGYPWITFQRNDEYVPPVWPEQVNEQQQMAHLDFLVNDLEQSVAHALECGATKAEMQFSEEWIVMFDLEGHPICFCAGKHFFDKPDFSLL